MCNEGELLEKFNIQLSPIPIPELTAQMKKVKEEGTEVSKVIKYCKDNMCINCYSMLECSARRNWYHALRSKFSVE